MFYIFSPQGKVFSGPLEQLRKVEMTSALAAMRPVQGDYFEEELETCSKQRYTASRRALEHYRQVLNKAESEPVAHAYQIMSQPVVVQLAHYSLKRAYEHFKKHPFYLMPVLDDNKQLLATLSRDFLYQTLLDNEGLKLKRLETIEQCFFSSAPEVLSADPVADVRRIANALVTYRLDAISIVEEKGELVGIVSRADILLCVVKDPPLSMWC